MEKYKGVCFYLLFRYIDMEEKKSVISRIESGLYKKDNKPVEECLFIKYLLRWFLMCKIKIGDVYLHKVRQEIYQFPKNSQ